MEKLLLRTKTALEDCERHLALSGAFGTEIEAYLTQYLLVVLCADIQQEIYRISEARASVVQDDAISTYVAATARRVLRSVGKDEIASYISMFGPNHKKMLNSLIDDADVTTFNNAISNRHNVAHKQGTQITFRELKNAVSAAQKILKSVERSLEHSGASAPTPGQQ